MSGFPDAMPHGPIREVFSDVFFVTGTMRGEFFGSDWQFSRNMTVVREDGDLTLVNSVRLNDEGLAQLDGLGTVKNVVRLGDMHGLDDRFYLDRYDADFWALPGMDIEDGIAGHKELVPDGEMPFSGCTLFAFRTSTRPEGILRLERDGGIMIACDSLQNWVAPDEFFDESTVETMQEMGFFIPNNLGLAWLHASQPGPEDFVRLKEVPFRHVLCGHGVPARNGMEAYHATFNRMFQV